MSDKEKNVSKFKVTGMSCAACSSKVERAVGALPGIESCTVNLLTGDMSVSGDVKREDVILAVKRAGYGVRGELGGREEKGEEGKETRAVLIRLGVSLAILLPLMYISMGHMLGAPLPSWLDTNPVATAMIQMLLSLAVMVVNQKFFINGARGIIRLSPNMDTLVSLGSLASFGYSVFVVFKMSYLQLGGDSVGAGELLHGLYFESAAMILALITLGKLLESIAKGRTADSVRALMSLAPDEAVILVDGDEVRVPVENIKVGDLFVLRPGERVPVDGILVEGVSAFDESALTGESIPRDKGVGEEIFAATVNTSGYIVARALRVGESTALSGIVRMVKDAQSTKAPIARLADRVSGIFVPVVLGLAALTLAGWLIAGREVGFAMARAISVLVISCPCALGLATPVAIMVGSGVGARNGILYKNAAALEMGGRISIVALDKTGTVTEGEPTVTDLIPSAGVSEDELLCVAVSLESRSEHPLSRAVCSFAFDRGTRARETEKFRTIPGAGVFGVIDGTPCFGVSYNEAKKQTNIDKITEEKYISLSEEGKTPLFFIRGGVLLGIIAVADRIRDDARAAIEALSKMGIRTVMLTGDNRHVAERVAKEAGIGEVRAELLPGDKEAAIKELSLSGRVLMVGDGINDAPALSRADLGMAIGRGTDIAIDSADVVLVSSRLSDVPTAIRLGRRTLMNIRENLFWAFLYNCLGIPLAAGLFGFAFSPMIGAAAMSLSSLSVVMNALRLGFFKPGKGILPRDGKKCDRINKKNNSDKENRKMTVEIKVEGMMCPHCEARVKGALEALGGVSSAAPDHKTGVVTVTVCEGVSIELLRDTISCAGYKVV